MLKMSKKQSCMTTVPYDAMLGLKSIPHSLLSNKKDETRQSYAAMLVQKHTQGYIPKTLSQT
jgi:hypothetical protein